MRVLLVPAESIASQLASIVAQLQANGIEVTVAQTLNIPAVAHFDLIAGPGTMPIDGALMDRCPHLRGVVSVGVGCEGFDRDAAKARSIQIATGMTHESAAGMASATVMLMLALCHDLNGATRAFAQGRRRDSERARSLDGAKVGIVGYGMIGREVARRLRAWDVPVVTASRSAGLGSLGNGVEGVPLSELLATSDVVTLHATHTRGAAPVLDRAALAAMKHGALLVNTARGGLVDEDALADALISGRLGGAALDCFAEEPLPAHSALRQAPNTILTPHQIGHTAGGADLLARRFTDNIVRLAAMARSERAATSRGVLQ